MPTADLPGSQTRSLPGCEPGRAKAEGDGLAGLRCAGRRGRVAVPLPQAHGSEGDPAVRGTARAVSHQTNETRMGGH